MKAERTKVDLRSCGSVYFKVETDQELSKTQLAELQLKAGYHPGGYGGPYNIGKTPEGYTWECFNSCD